MKIGVVGSRTFRDYDLMRNTLDAYDITEIISGGAAGADLLVERYAREKNINLTIHDALWSTNEKSAGPIRNQKIVDDSDFIIAFWDGKSRGTASTIRIARKDKKVVIIVHSEEI